VWFSPLFPFDFNRTRRWIEPISSLNPTLPGPTVSTLTSTITLLESLAIAVLRLISSQEAPPLSLPPCVRALCPSVWHQRCLHINSCPCSPQERDHRPELPLSGSFTSPVSNSQLRPSRILLFNVTGIHLTDGSPFHSLSPQPWIERRCPPGPDHTSGHSAFSTTGLDRTLQLDASPVQEPVIWSWSILLGSGLDSFSGNCCLASLHATFSNVSSEPGPSGYW
jgi:hypothetical protein